MVIIISNSYDTIPHWLGMIQIYQPNVWYATGASCILALIVIWTMNRLTENHRTNSLPTETISIVIVGYMVGNSPSFPPAMQRTRWIVLMWSLFCLNWLTGYSSNLISMITSPIHRITVDLY